MAELGSAIAEELLNPLAPLLAAGAGLSALVGSTLDAGIVASVGGINAVIGGVQRFRTERAIRRLVRPVRQQVRVRRSGATRRARTCRPTAASSSTTRSRSTPRS
jgi:cation-transporting P-type ATPase I